MFLLFPYGLPNIKYVAVTTKAFFKWEGPLGSVMDMIPSFMSPNLGRIKQHLSVSEPHTVSPKTKSKRFKLLFSVALWGVLRVSFHKKGLKNNIKQEIQIRRFL